MKIPVLCAITLAFSVSAFGQTTIPAAPTLTAGAEFKGLRFDWDRVPGATSYHLEFRANQTGPFVNVQDYPATATATRFTFPLHLYNWTYARYRLAACNSAGCSRSGEVSVSSLRRDAVGYFKSSQPVQGGHFGASKDLSPDGYNMVAAAPGEATESGDLVEGGAVYVFRRGTDRKWVQRARLEPQAVSYADYGLSLRVAISASGDTVAVGMPTFLNPGANGDGQVDVFQFTNNAWVRTRLPRPAAAYSFGDSVALSESGTTLAIQLNDGDHSVAIYRLINGVWQNVRTLSTTSLGYQELCSLPIMSRDGTAIAERCDDLGSETRPRRDYIRVHSGENWSVRTDITLGYPTTNDTVFGHNGFAIDRTGDTIAVQFNQTQMGTLNGTGLVKVYKRGSGGYSQVTTLTPGPWRSDTYKFVYGNAIALSGDGQTIAVGDGADNGLGWGPRAAPLWAGTEQTGAVHVYRLTDSWKLANMVKPNYNPNPGAAHIFGESVALNQSGHTLIVAVPRESSSASGIDGDWANTNRGTSGAIFMY
jgi:hypothetical protein